MRTASKPSTLIIRVLVLPLLLLALLNPSPVSAQPSTDAAVPAELREGAPPIGPENGVEPFETDDAQADDSEIQPPEVPVLQAEPAGPWSPGDQIQLTVTDAEVADGTTALLFQCSGTEAGDQCNFLGGQDFDQSQARFTDVLVARRLAVGSQQVGTTIRTIDCALESCTYVVARPGQGTEPNVTLPIAIDPAAPFPQIEATVTPSTDLATRDVVLVEVLGVPANTSVSVGQCAWPTCSSLTTYSGSNADGLASANVMVRRVIDGIDCAISACQLAIAGPSPDYFTLVNLSFDPAAPARPTRISVEPNSNLLDGQEVVVTGVNFIADDYLDVAQCLVDNDQACRYTQFEGEPITDSEGSFTGTISINRLVAAADCAVVACELVVRSRLGRTAVPLDFDDSVAPPPIPTLTLSPEGLLRDGEAVLVEVGNLTPDDPASSVVLLRTCVVGGGCLNTGFIVGADDDGVFRTTFTGRRFIAGGDCATPDLCYVEAWSGSQDTQVRAGFTFDPDAPPAPPAELTAFPTTGVWDGEQVAIAGSGLVPGEQFWMRQCRDGSNTECVTGFDFATADLLGNVSDRLLVTETFESGASTTQVDCAVEDCVISLLDQQTGESAYEFPLEFDATAPQQGYVQQLECVAWPTTEWATGPVPSGVDADELQAAIDRTLDGGTRGVVVIHGGQLVAEGYDTDVDQTTIFNSFSVSKSFTATVVGLLVQEGLLELDAPAPVPEWADPQDPRSEITLRHLLDMSPGLEWNESYSFDAETDIVRMLATPDSASFAANKPLVDEPGQTFHYSTGTTQILARIISQTLDKYDDDLLDELDDRLFDQIGVDPTIGIDGSGVWRGGVVTNMTTRNFAKLGLLYLRGGVWEDEQFLEQDWVDYARSRGVHNSGYAAQFWNAGGGNFRAVGLFGQGVHIYPDRDLVVAVNSATGSGGGNAGEIIELFANAQPATCDPSATAASDDTANVQATRKVDIEVLANDQGAGADLRPATLAVLEAPTNGTVRVVGTSIRYRPAVGFSGDETFTYGICTTTPFCATATVQVKVEPFDVSIQGPDDAVYRKVRPGSNPRVRIDAPGVPRKIVKAAIVESQAVVCRTGAPMGPVVSHDFDLRRKKASTVYRARWQFDPTWRGCRVLTVTLADGVPHQAYFRIR